MSTVSKNMACPAPLLEVRNLVRTFGKVEALRGVSFEAGPGELIGLIGPNGAGKSTLIRVLTGQIPPSSGVVRVAGLDVTTDASRLRRVVGYTPEEPALWDYLSAREFLTFIAEIRSANNLDEALELADLGADADRFIREYSQGMRRRTALAASLLGRPPLLVLDEALNGLDPPSSARVRQRLEILRSEGHTILLSTHALDTIERIASRVLMLSEGRLVADVRRTDPAYRNLESLFTPKDTLRKPEG